MTSRTVAAGAVICALLVAGCAWYVSSEPASVRIARVDFAEPQGAPASAEPLRITLDHNKLHSTDTLVAAVLMDPTLLSKETRIVASVMWTRPNGEPKSVSEVRWTGVLNAAMNLHVELRDANYGKYAVRVVITRPEDAGVVTSQAEFDIDPPLDAGKVY